MVKSEVIMENKNLYEILGLNPDSTKEEIKIAYRKLVRIYHPDVNKTKEAENYFKLLNNAAQTLLDDTKRLQYDALIGILGAKKNYVKKEDSIKNRQDKKTEENFDTETSKREPESGFYTYKTNKNTKNTGFFTNKNPKDTANNDFDADKTAKKQSYGPKIDGKDIETTVIISKKEQKQGTARKINVLHTDKCPKCAGAKYINGKVCALCHGAGEKSEHKVMNVKIPAGIKEGVKLKIQNEGEYGKFGGENGNLYLLIQIEKESQKNKQEPKEKNPVIEVSISPWQAVLGGKIAVPVNGKNVLITIPPLTKSNTRFKLKDEDDSLSLSGSKPDYTAIIRIDIKENLSKEEIELYKKLRELDLGLDSET